MTALDPFGWIGGTIDGRFGVEGVAGEGAFGVVYRGRHIGLEEPIAIKCLKIDSPSDGPSRDQFVQAFRTEARLLHRLSRQSAHIVQALDVGAAMSPNGSWTPYIVMEWLDGSSLEEDLAARAGKGSPPRSAAEAVSLLGPIADALALAHAEGIAHRDVKPGNLFLSKARGGTTLKLLDFGIAKVLTETSAGGMTLASAGTAIAALTPQYAAPEQFNAHYGATGPWTDVFALALIFIELVTGRRALGAGDVIQLYVAASDELVRPSARALGAALPDEVDRVLARAVAVQPAGRFGDAGAFWAAMTAAVGRFEPVGLAPTLSSSPPPSSASTMVLDRAGARLVRDGAPPPPAFTPARSVGEHRVCTVLFVDLVGLDRLAEQLEPEEIASITGAAVTTMIDSIEAERGLVDRASADRVMAVFGLPRAEEDDPERAVRAGLAIRDALGRIPLGRRGLTRLRPSVRVGIHTGRVFAGGASRAGDALAVLGEAVNLAARVHQSAPPGAVVLSSTTHRATDGLFVIERLSDPVLEREGHLLRAVLSVAERGPSTVFDFCGLGTKTVGRAVETARLLEVVETVQSERRAQVVTISGDAGVGKSRLLDELRRRLRTDSDVAIFSGRVSPRWETTELSLIRELLRDHFGVVDEDVSAAVLGKLGRGESDGRSAGDQELAAFLSAGAERELPSSQSSMAPDDAGVEARSRLHGAITSSLERLSNDRTIALLCDDVHWADDASLDMLDDLATRLGNRAVLIVCVARTELYERRPHWGEGRPSHSRLVVERLPSRHVIELVRDRLRRLDELSDEVVRLLCERSDGNPLILEETLLLLVDARVLTPSDERWQLRADALTSLVLPPTILGLIQARLDRLAAPVRRVLSHASVIGRTFWAEALPSLRALDPDAGETDVGEALAILRERQLVRARETSSVPGQAEFVFADAAVHEVAYASLRARVKSRQHLGVAAWLERAVRDGAMLAMIANHLDLGGDVAAAARAHARAGARAATRGRHEEALRHLERAAFLHEEGAGDLVAAEARSSIDDGEDFRVATWQERATVRIELGDVLRRIGRLGDAVRAYDEARAALLRSEGRKDHSLDETEPLRYEAQIDTRLALTHKIRGENAEARRLAERAIELATRAGAEVETAATWSLLAGVHRREGDLAACREASLRGLRVSRDAPRDDAYRASVSSLLVTLGAVFYSRGKLVQAERCYRQAARVLDEHRQPERLSSAVCNVAAVRFALGDWRGARQSFTKSLELSERAGNQHSAAIALSNTAEVDLKLGRVESALDAARRSVEIAERIDAKADLPDMLRNLAEALAASGRPAEAIDTARRALALSSGGGRVYLSQVAASLERLCRETPDASPELVELRRLAREELRRRSPRAT